MIISPEPLAYLRWVTRTQLRNCDQVYFQHININPHLFRSMSTASGPKSDTRYRLDGILAATSRQNTQLILTHFVVVKSGIASRWALPFLFPSPFIKILLDGRRPYVTTTKAWTLTPVWDEFFEL